MNKVKKISKNVVEIDGERYVKEESFDWLDVSDVLGEPLELEIEVHDKDKSWNELGLPEREDELLTMEQCRLLANSKYAKQLKMDGSSSEDDFFIKQPFDLNRKNGRVARFFAYSDYAGLGCGGYSDDFDSDLGVRFIRSKEE